MNPSRMPGVGVAVAVVASAVLAACASSPPAPPAAPAAAAPAAPPPAWQQGRSAAMASSTLAPLPGKLTVTPASAIPLNQIKVPEGFKVELWATGIPGARAMVRAPNGNVYVGTRTIGRVYEVADRGGQRTSRVVVLRSQSAARKARKSWRPTSSAAAFCIASCCKGCMMCQCVSWCSGERTGAFQI